MCIRDSYYTNTSTGKGLYHEVSQEQESRDVHTPVSYTHLDVYKRQV